MSAGKKVAIAAIAYGFCFVFLLGVGLVYAKTQRDDLAEGYRHFTASTEGTIVGLQERESSRVKVRRRASACHQTIYLVEYVSGGETEKTSLSECEPRDDWQPGSKVRIRVDPTGSHPGAVTEEDFAESTDWRKIAPFETINSLLPLPEKIPLFD